MTYQNHRKHLFYATFAAVLAAVVLGNSFYPVRSQRSSEPQPPTANFKWPAVSKTDVPNGTAGPARAGRLDPTFGIGGKVIDGIMQDSMDNIMSAALQADGKIVAMGYTTPNNGSYTLVLARYETSGSLDPSFGSGGKVITAIESIHWQAWKAIAIQADGRIVIAGGWQNAFGVVRFNPDGSLDSTFGTGGMVITQIGNSSEGRSVAIQTDGKILVAGASGDDFALVRYHPDGSLDPTFGGDGIVTTNIGIGDTANSVAIQADGRIVAAGFTTLNCTGGCDWDFALVRYNSDGSLDAGFGNGGKVVTPVLLVEEDRIHAIAIQPDGKIVAAGGHQWAYEGPRVLARYNTDGSLDSTFGSDGKVLIHIGSQGFTATSIALRPDGRILTGGNAKVDDIWRIGLTLHNPDGSLDHTIDGDGILTATPMIMNGALLQSDGKILAVGFNGDFILARYNAEGSLDPTFDSDGIVTTNFTNFYAGGAFFDVATRPDGKIVAAQPGYSVFRYHPDGSRDASFNGTGYVSRGSVGGATNVAVAVQPDGKTIVVGMAYVGDMYDMALEILRYNADGSPDLTFGEAYADSGKVVLSGTGGDWSDGSWVVLQSDGKIIVGGGDYIYRLNPNGSLDAGFGGGDGVANAPFYAYAGAIQANGKIVIAGRRGNGSGVEFALTRFNPGGTLDNAFGSGGLVSIPMGQSGDVVARTVAIQPDGKIVAGGYPLLRVNVDGSLDTGFGNGGLVTPPTGPFREIVIQSDGKLVISGSLDSDFAISRLNANGSLDTAFGGDGISTVDFNNSNDTAYGITLDAQGRVVVVGESDGKFALARLRLESNAPFDYDGDGKTDISVYRWTNGTWYVARSQTNDMYVKPFVDGEQNMMPADYDGDGKTDIAYSSEYNPPETYMALAILNSSTNTVSVRPFDAYGQITLAADFDGDGKADPTTWSGFGSWKIEMSQSGTVHSQQWGVAGDKAVPADFDGDGRAELAVWRPSNGRWYILNLAAGTIGQINWGVDGDIPVVGDYNGDGRADFAVYRPSNNTWYRMY